MRHYALIAAMAASISVPAMAQRVPTTGPDGGRPTSTPRSEVNAPTRNVVEPDRNHGENVVILRDYWIPRDGYPNGNGTYTTSTGSQPGVSVGPISTTTVPVPSDGTYTTNTSSGSQSGGVSAGPISTTTAPVTSDGLIPRPRYGMPGTTGTSSSTTTNSSGEVVSSAPVSTTTVPSGGRRARMTPPPISPAPLSIIPIPSDGRRIALRSVERTRTVVRTPETFDPVFTEIPRDRPSQQWTEDPREPEWQAEGTSTARPSVTNDGVPGIIVTNRTPTRGSSSRNADVALTSDGMRASSRNGFLLANSNCHMERPRITLRSGRTVADTSQPLRRVCDTQVQ